MYRNFTCYPAMRQPTSYKSPTRGVGEVLPSGSYGSGSGSKNGSDNGSDNGIGSGSVNETGSETSRPKSSRQQYREENSLQF